MAKIFSGSDRLMRAGGACDGVVEPCHMLLPSDTMVIMG